MKLKPEQGPTVRGRMGVQFPSQGCSFRRSPAFFFLTLGLLALLSFSPLTSRAASTAPVRATRGMVVASERLASQIGADILRDGGNAVDAAVAVGFALAVTLPAAGNLGGGGFMLVSRPDGKSFALDYRETAPAGATRDMYLDEKGEVVPSRASTGHLAVAVPGTVAGLLHAASQWGTLPPSRLIAPAIQLAEKGFVVPWWLSDELTQQQRRLTSFPATAAAYYPGGKAPAPGSTLVQADLAATLRRISREGAAGFYRGEVADRIAEEMKRGGGLITREDLAAYKVVVREPVVGQWKGLEVLSMPPPSSGGIHILQMLNMLEPWDLGQSGHNSAATLHLMAEAMKRAFADRSHWLGDPDFTPVPVEGLLHKDYAAWQRSTFNLFRATPSAQIRPGDPSRRGPIGPGYVAPAYLPSGPHTTHYSVVDSKGMAVSNTYTLNFFYGSGVTVPGTGVLLNNEMDDFSARSGVPNAYGLIGGEANAIAPGKRPLSSMSPTIVRRGGKVELVTGSPGGSRIINIVLQVILNVYEHNMDIAEAVSAPRVYHQWLPDELHVEEGLSVDTLRLLGQMGYTIVRRPNTGAANSIQVKDGVYHGAPDPRDEGAAVGY